MDVVKIDNLSKEYKLGSIGGKTLRADLSSWWARVRGKDDPNTKIGTEIIRGNETFMALERVNLVVRKGDTLGIIGGNGAGKSTLLKILSRVTSPTDGYIYIKGRISSILEVGTGFDRELTGRENIYMNGAILGMTKSEIARKLDEIIEFSECAQFIDTPVKRYSSGMYVKLAFAVAAHLDSEILVMDEVLAVGDMKFQQKCLGKMGDAADREGRTVLYVSHNMNTIRQLCSRCVVLKQGKLIFDGGVNEAISIYMESSKRLDIRYELSENPRKGYMSGYVKLKSLEILGRDNNIFPLNDKLVFELSYDVSNNIENLYMRLILRTLDRQAVGMAMSSQIDFKAGDLNRNFFEFDLSCIAPGDYVADIIMLSMGEYGGLGRHDICQDVLYFTVNNDLNFSWSNNWGHSFYNEIKLVR